MAEWRHRPIAADITGRTNTAQQGQRTTDILAERARRRRQDGAPIINTTSPLLRGRDDRREIGLSRLARQAAGRQNRSGVVVADRGSQSGAGAECTRPEMEPAIACSGDNTYQPARSHRWPGWSKRTHDAANETEEPLFCALSDRVRAGRNGWLVLRMARAGRRVRAQRRRHQRRWRRARPAAAVVDRSCRTAAGVNAKVATPPPLVKRMVRATVPPPT